MSFPAPQPAHASLWLDLTKAMIGPFVGAGLAFLANAWNERRKHRKENLAAGNLALSILKQQLQTFFNVRNGFLTDRTNRMKVLGQGIPRWLQFKPTMFTFSGGLKFNFQSLAFLFELGNPDVFDRLAIAEGRYLDLVAVVNKINDTLESLQKQLVAIGIEDGVSFYVDVVEGQLGPAIVGKANSFTDALMKRFDDDEADYLAAAQALRSALLKKYKSNEVIKLVPLPGFNRLDWGNI